MLKFSVLVSVTSFGSVKNSLSDIKTAIIRTKL